MMNNILYKCSHFMYTHRHPVLTCRLLHILSSSVKSEHLNQKLSSVSCFLSKQPTSSYKFTPVRTLYYLENENVKEFRRFPTVLELSEETIKDVCLRENPKSLESWDNVKMEIMTTCLTMTEENFDSILMQVLLQNEKLQLAQSFMDYLKERKLKPNFVTLCKYMVLCSKNVDLVGQDVILETYEKIISDVDTSVLNTQMVEFLVQGLCATDEWRKSFDYVKQLPKSQLSNGTVNAIVCAALRNQDYKQAWIIMNTWYRSGTTPSTEVFEDYMKFLIDLYRKNPVQANSYFTQMVEYIRNKDIILKQKAVIYIEEYFKRSSKYSTFYTKVSRDGVCSGCKNKLEPCSLTKEEFLYLRNAFLHYSVKKSDIFINTTESEFEKYHRFIERFKPFDIVLDGLNVAHSNVISEFSRGKKPLAEKLFCVVQHLSQHMGRILVLGRYHMKKWPSTVMGQVKKMSHIFYVSNISQDDPFLIYAALASGPNTLLVSGDMMRDHMSRLPDPKLVYLFKKWQQSHQVYLAQEENKDEMLLMGPLKHNIAIQGSMESGFHVPFNNDVKREPYEELNNWLCIQKRF